MAETFSIKTNLLSKFNFGDPEAKTDDVLEHCFLNIKGIDDFLAGTKNIIIGERGVGKSAVFKLIKEKKLEFTFPYLKDKEKLKKQLVVAIDDDLQYAAIANIIQQRFSSNHKNEKTKYRFLWEIYIVSRVISELCETCDKDPELSTLHEDFSRLLGIKVEGNLKLSTLISGLKITFAPKTDAMGNVMPSVSLEKGVPQVPVITDVSDSEIAEIITRLRKYLKANNVIAMVIVDKVDDFVVGDSYEEQKKNLQALLECTQAYRHPEIKLKVFMRADLFSKLDFVQGYDKISTQVVRLEWNRDTICEFAARRLYYNYKNLEIKLPRGRINEKMLSMNASERSSLLDVFETTPDSFSEFANRIVQLFSILWKLSIESIFKNSHTARKTNLMHEGSLTLIRYIFPHRVTHFNGLCKKDDAPIEEFFESHFKLGGDSPNPRLLLILLNYVFEISSSYYEKNPDQQELAQNSNDEYELILREHILLGYDKLQQTARTTISRLNPSWQAYVDRLFMEICKPADSSDISADWLKKVIQWDKDDSEFTSFMAFYTHLGLFVLKNLPAKYQDRLYCLPLILMKCEKNFTK